MSDPRCMLCEKERHGLIICHITQDDFTVCIDCHFARKGLADKGYLIIGKKIYV